MEKFFHGEYLKSLEDPIITDAAGQLIYLNALSEGSTASMAQGLYLKADEKRLGSPRDQHEAAHVYLALAFLSARAQIAITHKDKPIESSLLFHFAGHAFREIGQINRAADAYWRAGVVGAKNGVVDQFAIRSLARAKSCYSEIGETEKSDRMHILEWEARRQTGTLSNCVLLSVWKITSDYGTSVKKWFWSIILLVLSFSVVYEVLHDQGAIHQGQAWTPMISSIYFTLVTTATVGYGEFVPIGCLAQLAVVLNIVLGYFLLGVGTTILGRKVIGR